MDNGTIAKNLGEGGEMTCVATGSGNLILGDSNGNINIYNRCLFFIYAKRERRGKLGQRGKGGGN